jgi:hypothetical protein
MDMGNAPARAPEFYDVKPNDPQAALKLAVFLNPVNKFQEVEVARKAKGRRFFNTIPQYMYTRIPAGIFKRLLKQEPLLAAVAADEKRKQNLAAARLARAAAAPVAAMNNNYGAAAPDANADALADMLAAEMEFTPPEDPAVAALAGNLGGMNMGVQGWGGVPKNKRRGRKTRKTRRTRKSYRRR